jgi:DNA transformation protein
MKVSDGYKSYVEEQFSAFGPVIFKKMFGGYGIFKDGIMFGMISPGDIFRMRADEQNVNDFKVEGMKQFPSHGGKKGMPYWDVPAHVLEDQDELKIWAEKSFAAANRTKK